MKVRTNYLPIRMVIEQKAPVTLNVSIKNTEESPRNFSVVVSLPGRLGFDRAGLEREKRMRIREVLPGEWGEAKFRIYPKIGLKPGIYDIDVYVREHPIGRFDKDITIVKTTAPLRIISANQ